VTAIDAFHCGYNTGLIVNEAKNLWVQNNGFLDQLTLIRIERIDNYIKNYLNINVKINKRYGDSNSVLLNHSNIRMKFNKNVICPCGKNFQKKPTTLGAFVKHLLYGCSNFRLQDPYYYMCTLFNTDGSFTGVLLS
jgi:hypothetical protein